MWTTAGASTSAENEHHLWYFRNDATRSWLLQYASMLNNHQLHQVDHSAIHRDCLSPTPTGKYKLPFLEKLDLYFGIPIIRAVYSN